MVFVTEGLLERVLEKASQRSKSVHSETNCIVYAITCALVIFRLDLNIHNVGTGMFFFYLIYIFLS